MGPELALAAEAAVSLLVDTAHIGAGAYYLLPREKEQQGARASFTAYGARLFGCLNAHQRGRVTITGCAVLELGRISARGLSGGNVVRGERAIAPWVALGGGLRAALEIAPRWDVSIELGLGFPLDRPRVFRFRNADESFFEVPAASSRSALGARYTFY
jgi:hypothetical protein